MGLFDAFRTIPGPTLYGENRSAVSADLIVAGLITAFLMIFVSFVIGIVPATQSAIRTVSAFLRVFLALFVGCSILVCEFGDGWRTDEKTADVYLKQPFIGTADLNNVHTEVHATIGIHVGLHGVNITLKGSPTNQSVGGVWEEIDYNNHFSFGILQGRLGFGSQAGLISQEFREAQYRGAPLPILWVAEYFTLDGEDIRWGRNFRQAGYYTSLLLWTSFAWWILATFLLTQALPYGAIFLALTGLTLITACGVYGGMHDAHGPPFEIPIADGVILELHYGWSFILALFNGILCLVISLAIYIMYLRFPEFLYEFFHLDVLEEEDLLEVQRGIDINSGYLCTWDEEKQQTVLAVEARGTLTKVPLDGGGASADVEAGRTPRQTESFAELRKSRRSIRKTKDRSSRGVSLAGSHTGAGTLSRQENGAELRKITSSPAPSEQSASEVSPAGLVLTSALKTSQKMKKRPKSPQIPVDSDQFLAVTSNEAATSSDELAVDLNNETKVSRTSLQPLVDGTEEEDSV